MKNLRFTFFFAFLIFSYVPSFAVVAYPYPFFIQTLDGDSVEIKLKGDEHFKFAIQEDKYLILPVDKTWYYAYYEHGDLLPSTVPVCKNPERISAAKPYLTEKESFIAQKRELRTNEENPAFFNDKKDVTGERKVLVVLMQFKDIKMTKDISDFDRLFNGINYSDNGAVGSVKDYYGFCSYGKLDLSCDVYGPYTSNAPASFYGENNDSGNDKATYELFREALNAVSVDADLSQYDADGDGVIDNIHIIYAGYGEEAGAESWRIWAHESSFRPITVDGMKVSCYSCSPELRGRKGNKITHIGPICHEIGHALGVMDYYDTNYAVNGSFDGTGMWDIMAQGSWNDDGASPAGFNPHAKAYILGWCELEDFKEEEYVIAPSYISPVVYRLRIPDSNECYLFENRQQYYFDSTLPSSGLMVYHLHPNIDILSRSNNINASHPQGFYPVCAAESRVSIESDYYGDINSDCCPFPGRVNKTEFHAYSQPKAFSWTGKPFSGGIYRILQTTDGNITLKFSENVIPEEDDPGRNDNEMIVYQESFENGIARFSFTAELNGKWYVYPNNTIVIGASNIPDPYDGECLLALHNFSNSMSKVSEITSDEVCLGNDANYRFCFNYDHVNIDTYDQKLDFLIQYDDSVTETHEISLSDTDTWSTASYTLRPGIL